MKKFMLLLLVLLSINIFSQTAILPLGGGTSSNPYQIASIENLYWIASAAYRWNYYYIQTADIDASSTSAWFSGTGWSPIGNYPTAFTGTYDGRGYSINSLCINNSTSTYVGLFGRVSGSSIKNLNLTNANIVGGDHVGALVGYNYNASTIESCSCNGFITGNSNTGGLAGSNWVSSIISKSFSDCNVTGNLNTGGLVGYNYNSSSIDNSYSFSNITSSSSFGGGLVGKNYDSAISNSYSTGAVIGEPINIGGLIGYNNSSVNNCFWDIESSGVTNSSGGTGKTTAEMKTLSTFTNAGWDFTEETVNGINDYWNIKSINNNGYPYLYRQFPDFTEVAGTGLQVVWSSSSDWGDYDNDGDLDIVVSGYYGNSYNGFAAIYSNDNGTFTNINAGLLGLAACSVSWGDYDNDSDLDILFTGTKPNGDGYAYIYRNYYGVFTNINPGIVATKYGSSAWGDYDNDGDLDVLHTGYTTAGRIANIYQNNNGIFSNIEAGLTGVENSSACWGDYDNDGDQDILLTGYTGSARISKIYRNDTGVFADINAGLTDVNYSSVAWGDYDNDGDLDVLIIGNTGSAYISKIYKNDYGVFTDINAGLTGVYDGSASWGDYDNDGDLDILITGYTGSLPKSDVYRNDSGIFTNISAGLANVRDSSSSWGDYDNDGDLDILLTGYTGSAGISKLYRNNSIISNTVPASPSNLESFVDSTSVEFNWINASDNETPQSGLSYNLYVRPLDQTYYRMSPMSDRDSGYRSVARAGNTGQNNKYTVRDLPDGRYTWSVQAVDHAFAGSVFAPAQSFTVGVVPDLPEVPVALEASHKGINTFKANWTGSTGAEFYNLDVATDAGFSSFATGYYNFDVGNVTSFTVTGLEMDTIYYYRVRASNAGGSSAGSNTISISTGYSSFTDVATTIPQASGGDLAWGDYDNDGDLDLFKSGHISKKEDNPKTDMALIYRNDSGVFTDIQAGIPGFSAGSAAWGDYDNDGDLDLLVTAQATVLISRIYRNDSGIFTDINAGLTPTSLAGKWGDYDNDGDLDILLAGTIYRNDSGIFTNINAGLISAPGEWGDYDNDSDLDILLKGNIYRNDSGAFTNINAGLNTVNGRWGDYDNDGDLDILMAGYTGKLSLSCVYRNEFGIFTIVAQNLASYPLSGEWGDFDNDGDLDILLSDSQHLIKIIQNCEGELIDSGLEFFDEDGYNAVFGDYDNDGDLDIISSGYYITKIYRNERYRPNAVPSSPSNLSSSVNGSEVTLSWVKAADTETPQGGLAYNIYLGTWRDNISSASPMSNILSGYRRIVTKGNAGQSESWKINDLPDGKYYWSVQAVDNNYAGSQFADEQSFNVGEVQALPDPPVALEETEMTESSFKANWAQAAGAEGYYIDIAYDTLFTNYVPGCQNIDVEDILTYTITDLNTAATHYYRLRSYNYAGTSGSSNVITAARTGSGTVTVTSPNGGEIMTRGGQYEIKWTDEINENVRLDLYKYNEFLDCITESTPSDGSYIWTIPLSLAGKYFSIRISSSEYCYIYDLSDESFEILINSSGAKITQELTYSWNSTTAGWEEHPYIKQYNYFSGGNVQSWVFLSWDDVSSSYVINEDNTYNSTYYSGYYNMRNYYSYYISEGKPSYWYSRETTYKYNLQNVLLARYIHEFESYSGDNVETITDKIYGYLNGKIDYIFDHTVIDGVSVSEYMTYYIYDVFERLISQNYHIYYTDYKPAGEMIERTNWTYSSGDLRRADVLTEKIESGSWINKSKRILHSDSSDRVRKDVLLNWTSGAWKETTMDSLYYYDDGKLRRTVNFYYSTSTSSYIKNKRIDYIYNIPLNIENESNEVSDHTLYQNYPNPFNPVTSISYALPQASQVELNVYNLNGQLVQSLVNGRLDKGIHKAEFNGADLTSGMYIYSLKVDNKVVSSKKMMLLK